MKGSLKIFTCFLFIGFLYGCASPPPPLNYLALEKPKDMIDTKRNESLILKEEFSRGGFYFFNEGFRPAADIRSYLERVEMKADAKILRNVDIELVVPFAIDILGFGYNSATDSVTVGRSVD